MRIIFMVVFVALLTASAHAQPAAPVTRYGEEDKPKTQAEIELQQKADADYKRSLSNVPDARSADPWGSVRSEPAAKAAPAKRKSHAPN